MKSSFHYFLILTFSLSCQTGRDYSEDVDDYVQAYNDQNMDRYVELLIPAEYGNKEENKTHFIKAYESILGGDIRRLSEVKAVHSVDQDDQTQVLYRAMYGGVTIFFIGTAEGQNDLKFTTLFNANARIDQIKQKIPSLDKSFYDLIEPQWENVIRFELGEKIPELEWTSISGKPLNLNGISEEVIVLNFWHTTCPPCIKEIPDLNELVHKFTEVAFIAPIPNIDADYLKNNFLVKHEFIYDIVIVDPMRFNVYSFPQHIVIRNLEVVEIIDGYSPDNLVRLKKAIKGEV